MSVREKNGRTNQSLLALAAEAPGRTARGAPDPILVLRDVEKTYRTGVGGFTAINDVSLDIYAGEFVGVIGKSGAGKTTLLNMISGVSEITSGEVLFSPPKNGGSTNGPASISVHSLNENEMALWRGRNLGIVYQSFELLPQMDLIDNIMLPQDFTGNYRPLISYKKALELLEMVELSEHAKKKPAQISGGQKQRIAIARAVVNDPPVILAAEPTGNLDTVTAETIFKIFEGLVASGKTVIMVTHDLSLAPRFSRWIQIADGMIVSARDRANTREARPTNMSGYEGKITISQLGNAGLKNMPLHSGEAFEAMDSIGERSPGLTETRSPIEEPDGRSFPAGAVEKPLFIRGEFSGEKSPAAGEKEPAILLQNVVKTYVNAAGEFPALKGIDLRIDYGQFVSLIGKSGSGKSTLLNMLTGIDHPTSGEVIIGGKRIYEMSESKRALWRGQNVGIVFQFFQLLPTLTILENTMLPMDYCNVFPVHERIDRAMALLEKVGLEPDAHKLPASVSSGQQQSAAIARALANDPPIIVADEPTGNLDSRAADVILRLFNDLAKQGKTILLVTHDQSFTSRTERTVILSDGEFVDETLARAFPFIDHPLMLTVSHQITYQEADPGALIIKAGEPVESFFMVAHGEVEIFSQDPEGGGRPVARFGPGDYFGGVEFMQNGRSIAHVRAAGGRAVRLAVLDKDWQTRYLNGSPKIPPALTDEAVGRLLESNRDLRGR